MPGGHHPRSAVQHRAEIVSVPQFGLPGRNAHAHRELQLPLRGNGGIDCGLRRCERGDHTVAGVAEQVAVMRLDRALQHPVMRQKGRPHRVRVCFPPTGRPLNIGEQKRDDPRSLRARVAGIRKWSDVLGRRHIRRRPRRERARGPGPRTSVARGQRRAREVRQRPLGHDRSREPHRLGKRKQHRFRLGSTERLSRGGPAKDSTRAVVEFRGDGIEVVLGEGG